MLNNKKQKVKRFTIVVKEKILIAYTIYFINFYNQNFIL